MKSLDPTQREVDRIIAELEAGSDRVYMICVDYYWKPVAKHFGGEIRVGHQSFIKVHGVEWELHSNRDYTYIEKGSIGAAKQSLKVAQTKKVLQASGIAKLSRAEYDAMQLDWVRKYVWH